jgi:hypothetical protein
MRATHCALVSSACPDASDPLCLGLSHGCTRAWDRQDTPIVLMISAFAATCSSSEATNEIVGRRRLEESRREAERPREELHDVFMQLPVPMCILNGPEHRFTFANQPYINVVQRAVIGKTLSEAFTADEVGTTCQSLTAC